MIVAELRAFACLRARWSRRWTVGRQVDTLRSARDVTVTTGFGCTVTAVQGESPRLQPWDESDNSRNNYHGSYRRLWYRVSRKDTHASAAVDEARYPSRGPDWHGPHPHRTTRVGNRSVVGTVCDRGTSRLQSWEDVSIPALGHPRPLARGECQSVRWTNCDIIRSSAVRSRYCTVDRGSSSIDARSEIETARGRS